MFDERGTPLERRKLKTKLCDRQSRRCTPCRKPFESIKGTELHRAEARRIVMEMPWRGRDGRQPRQAITSRKSPMGEAA